VLLSVVECLWLFHGLRVVECLSRVVECLSVVACLSVVEHLRVDNCLSFLGSRCVSLSLAEGLSVSLSFAECR
jgi:hypothetical protein